MMKVIVQTATPNIEKSESFYSALGFKKIASTNKQIYQADGVEIELNTDRYARPGIKVIKRSWEQEKELLEAICQPWKKNDSLTVFGLGPTCLYLEEGETEKTKGDTKSILGNYSGVSIETADLKRVYKMLSILGFKLVHGDLNSSWISMEEESGFQISLMAPNCCPHMFFNPSLNYFNGSNNLDIIDAIRNSGIEITEEITHFNKEGKVDNIIIKDLGGLGFFIFND